MIKRTNSMLKSVISKVGYDKDKMVRYLGVDIQNCEPHDVTTLGYAREWIENVFLFIDERNRLLGILKGSEYVKDFSNAYTVEPRVKNRKFLTPAAKHILMITPEMRTYKPVVKSRRDKEPGPRELLRKRLQAYKAKKNEVISHENMKSIIQEVMGYLTANMFNNGMGKAFSKLSSSSNEMFDVIRSFNDDARNYVSYERNYTGEMESAKKHGYQLTHSFYGEDYARAKNRIIEWYKTINSLKQSISA